MSIYNIMAFNAAHDQAVKNDKDAQDIQAKKVQTQQAQEELELNKKLDQAKIKQARVEGMSSDYVGNQLEKKINEYYKNQETQLKSVSGLQDIYQHKAMTGAAQAKNMALQLHANDPDVQAHVATLSGIMGTQQPSQPVADVNPATGGESQQAQMSVPAGGNLPSIPGITPVQPQPSPQNVGAQTAQNDTAAPSAEPVAAPAPAQPPAPAQNQPQGGIDLSPFEQVYGVPKGSMWLNPSTMKPEINPIWKSNVEAQQRAAATYEENRPYREEKFYDDRFNKLDKNLDPSSFRSGAFGDSKKTFDRGERLKTLIDATFEQPGGADSRQVAELAIGLQSMLSGGTGSTTEVMALLPKSAAGDVNKISEWISNNPTGANQQLFVNRLRDTVYREMDVTQAQMDRTRIQRLANFSDLKNRDPQKYQDILDNYGLTEDKVNAYRKKGIQGLREIAKDERTKTNPDLSSVDQKYKSSGFSHAEIEAEMRRRGLLK